MHIITIITETGMKVSTIIKSMSMDTKKIMDRTNHMTDMAVIIITITVIMRTKRVIITITADTTIITATAIMKATTIPPISRVKPMEDTTIATEAIKITIITILMIPKPGTVKTAMEHRTSTATKAISTVPIVHIRAINITIMENTHMGRMSMNITTQATATADTTTVIWTLCRWWR